MEEKNTFKRFRLLIRYLLGEIPLCSLPVSMIKRQIFGLFPTDVIPVLPRKW
jgi:hypothetical protein